MLSQVAAAGGGTYCFIPDSTIVGTAFVNWTANFLSMAAQRCVLSLVAENGSEFVRTYGEVTKVGAMSHRNERNFPLKCGLKLVGELGATVSDTYDIVRTD